MMKPLQRLPARAVTQRNFDGGGSGQAADPRLPQAVLEARLTRPIAPRVFVVDDDPMVRASLRAILKDWPVEDFADAASFLHDADAGWGDCLIVDIQMPLMSGIELQYVLSSRGMILPVIVLSGYADVPLAVTAMKAGAFEFIQKPFEAAALHASVSRALAWSDAQRLQHEKKEAALSLLERLTEREREVFNYLIEGYANKVVAFQLGISPRTVEVHRARILEKLDSSCLADLVRIAHDAELRGSSQTSQAKI
jgi:two-component system response regulator FixJ